MPPAGLKLTDVAPSRFEPPMENRIFSPCRPLVAMNALIWGAEFEVTTKESGVLVPPGPVTHRERDMAVAEIATVQVIWVAVAWMADTVIPVGEIKFTAVTPLRFVPVMVRVTVWPCLAVPGLSAVIWGAGTTC